MSLGDYARATTNKVKNKIKQKLVPILLKYILPIIAVIFLMIILVGIIVGLLGADTASAGEGYNSMEGITGNTVEEKVWFSLKNIGISEYAVAGVMGNIEGESSFDPHCVESNGEGIGLCQWSFGRKTQLQKYATSKGVEWSDVDTQIEFLIGEITKGGGANGYASFQMSGTHYGYTYDTWYKATDTDTATEAFMAVFERPDMTVAHTDRRKKSAKEYYEQFKGKSYNGDVTLEKLKEKFPNGKYWGGTTSNGYGSDYDEVRTSQRCKTQIGDGCVSPQFDGGRQCFGFARKIAYDYYGEKVSRWEKVSGSSGIKAGDVIRVNNDTHSAWVISVSGNTLTVVDCNWSGYCKIRWGGTFDKSKVTYYRKAPYAIGAK